MKGGFVVQTALEANAKSTFYRVEDIQRMMGISRASAYDLTRSKGFPSIRVGARIIIPADLFQRWVEAQAQSEVK